MAVRRYDPLAITVVVNGKLITGFADDTFVNVEFDEDSFGKVIGVQGDGTRYRINNQGAKVSLTLQHSAPANDLFMAMWTADQQSGTGAGAFLMRDLLGSSLYSSPEVWPLRIPTFERGRAVSMVTWVLDCISMTGYLGSNV